jgi:hypothetical protein
MTHFRGGKRVGDRKAGGQKDLALRFFSLL